MDRTKTKKTMQQLLEEEKAQLLAEVNTKIRKIMSMIKSGQK